MLKTLTTFVCIFAIFFGSSAFAYKKDVQPDKPDNSTDQTVNTPQEDEDYRYESKGRGLVIAGYICIAAGGAAAIAGSTIVAATNKRTAGIVVGSSGAAIGLAGSLMLLFGSRSGYALAPTVDPEHKTFGLAMSANF